MTGFKRVFIDTAPIIYYLENNSLYRDAIYRYQRQLLVNVICFLQMINS